MNDVERMKELIAILNRAGKAYYQENREEISNYEYDKLYDELKDLEEKTGTVLFFQPDNPCGIRVDDIFGERSTSISDAVAG